MDRHSKKVTGFRFNDESVLEKLNVIADKNCRTRNREVEYALQLYVKSFEEKNGEIKINQ